MGGLVRLRGGTEFRFARARGEGGGRFSISAAGGEGGCQLGWRAHAGLKPASRRCEREIFLRSLALALNFPCSPRSHRLPSTTMVVSTSRYCRRASEDVCPLNLTDHFRNSLTKWRILPNLAGGRGGGGVDSRSWRRVETPLPDCGLPRRRRGPPSPIAMCAEGRIWRTRPPTLQNDAGISRYRE